MNPAFVNLILEIRAVKTETAPLFSHDYLPGHRIPCELADAQIAASAAWDAYDAVIDREHTAAERQDALAAALAADNAVKSWNTRWQRLGGTSDIRSIEDAERAFAYVPMVKVLSVMP